jgi:hypothetical protein
MPAFPHAEVNATNETNTVQPPPVAGGATQSAVLPATQEGTTPLVAQCAMAEAISFSQEDPIEDSDDDVQPTTKKGRKSSRKGTK